MKSHQIEGVAERCHQDKHLEGMNRGRILLSCPDQPGVVAAVSQFLYENGANIIQSDQHSTDPEGGQLFMRVEFDLDQLSLHLDKLKSSFVNVASRYDMEWEMKTAASPKKTAIFVSKEDHCLLELLWQWQSGELDMDIKLVISNHDVCRPVVEKLDIPYYYIPVTKENKDQAEQEQFRLLEEYGVELIILARYMQILSPKYIERYPNRIINIHHSFLPAFVGANPYKSAHERGVKIIGATAHYVTEDLDQGPIIEQDVQRVSHRYNVDDLKKTGRYIERIVLARAVAWHLQDRVLTYHNKTVVFT